MGTTMGTTTRIYALDGLRGPFSVINGMRSQASQTGHFVYHDDEDSPQLGIMFSRGLSPNDAHLSLARRMVQDPKAFAPGSKKWVAGDILIGSHKPGAPSFDVTFRIHSDYFTKRPGLKEIGRMYDQLLCHFTAGAGYRYFGQYNVSYEYVNPHVRFYTQNGFHVTFAGKAVIPVPLTRSKKPVPFITVESDPDLNLAATTPKPSDVTKAIRHIPTFSVEV